MNKRTFVKDLAVFAGDWAASATTSLAINTVINNLAPAMTKGQRIATGVGSALIGMVVGDVVGKHVDKSITEIYSIVDVVKESVKNA